jgi:glycosyltransferase involved in cell wall biosynthesis
MAVPMRDGPLVVCFAFVGDELGGSHVSAIKLIEALDPTRVRAVIVLHVPDGPVAAYLQLREVPFEIMEPGGWVGRDGLGRPAGIVSSISAVVGALPALVRFLRTRRVDILHTNDGRMHVIWALAARIAGARQVWHHRGDPDARGVRLLAPWIADHIVTVSRFAKPRAPVLPVGHKLTVLHSPFDAPQDGGNRAAARAMLSEELRTPPDTRYLAMFGLLITRKRPLAFVDAIAAYSRRHPEIPVMGLLFGVPGKEEPELDQAILRRAEQLGVGSSIRLMGYRDPVEPWMQGVDVMLVPAVREPFGRTLIEAMFLGTPVVATDCGGNPEAIEHGVNGLLVPPDVPEAFVEPIHRLLTEADFRARLVESARRRAHADYDVASHVAGLMAIYDGKRPRAKHPDVRSLGRTAA